MSATKRHLEALADQHRLYAESDHDARFQARWTILLACSRVLDATNDESGDVALGMLEAVNVLHAMFDELKAVDAWQPAED
jgi:hypothetical protein